MGRARISFRTKDRDAGWNDLRRRWKETKDAYALAGIVGDAAREAHEGGISTVALAAVQEFGSPRAGIPSRSFVRATFDAKKGEYWPLVKKLAGAFLDGKVELNRALGLLGAKVSSDMKRQVTQGAGIPPPNAPATLERKQAKGRGNVRTLIDTARMIGALSWEIVINGKKVAAK